MADKVFPKGIIAFKPKDSAPTWVKASVAITLEDLKAWVNGEGKEYLTDYNGKKQLKLQITERQDGKFSISVDTFKPQPKEQSTGTTTRAGITTENSDDLPF